MSIHTDPRTDPQIIDDTFLYASAEERDHLKRVAAMYRARSRQTCPECRRIFNLSVEVDAQDWYFGHDCEVSE